MLQFATIASIIISLAGGAYGISLLARLRKLYRLDYLNSLFYYRILHFTFGIYGILGALAIKEILLKYDLQQSQIESVMLALPIFGVPFLIAAWYILIKTANELIGKKVSPLVSIIYFVIATISFLIYALILRKISDISSLNTDTLSQTIRIIIYGIDLLIKIYLFVIILSSALKTQNRTKRLFLVRFSFLLTGLAVFTSLALHFSYVSTYIGVYFLLLFFCSDLAIIMLIRLYLKKNSLEYLNITDSLEDLYQKYGISKREKEIISEVCMGKTNQQIADDLFITLQTVKDHTYNIFRKVNVKNRVQLTQLFNIRKE